MLASLNSAIACATYMAQLGQDRSLPAYAS
jgi:hypothetical protein